MIIEGINLDMFKNETCAARRDYMLSFLREIEEWKETAEEDEYDYLLKIEGIFNRYINYLEENS